MSKGLRAMARCIHHATGEATSAVELLVPGAIGFAAGFVIGRWWALVLPAGAAFLASVAIEGGDDIPPGWFFGLLIIGIGSAFVAAGVLAGKAVRSKRANSSSTAASKLSVGEAVAAGAGLFLLASMFLDWFQEAPTCTLADIARLDAWAAFGGLDVLLALAALVPIAHAAMRSTVERGLPLIGLAVSGAIALVLIAAGVLSMLGDEVRTCPLGASAETKLIHTTSRPGLWIAVAFAILLTVAGRSAAGEKGELPSGTGKRTPR